MPQISVVIPAYNSAHTIRETIDSVLNQTYSDFELIVINDGSTDSTLEIVQSISDSRLKVFSYPNAGLAASRNRGIAQASGEYISFIDADDLWTPDKLDAQLEALKAHPEAAVVYSWNDYIDEKSQRLSQGLSRGSHISACGDVFARLLLFNFIESGSNVLIRASALAEVGGFDGSLTNCHDRDMWLRLARRFHFVCVPKVQILYRISPTSMSSNVLGLEKSGLRIFERLLAEAPESIKGLKNDIFANRYKYLIVKALQGTPERRKAITALRFLWNAIKYDPSLLRKAVVLKVLFKILSTLLMPPKISQFLFSRFPKLDNLNALFLYCRLDF